MTELEKQKIIKLRNGGYGYIRIAQTLGMSETANQDKVVRRTAVEFECPVCHEKFKDYPRNNRKYCSRECYIKRRYGDEP